MNDSPDQEIRTLQSIFWSERDPDGLAFASLADAFRRKGSVRQALDLLTDGMSRHPDFVTGHVVATRLYVDQGMDSEAELAARRVLDLDPENLVGLSAMATVLSRKGETGEASRHRTMLMSVDPDSDEARAVAALELEPVAADGPPPLPESALAVDEDIQPPEITEVVPEPQYQEGSADSLLEDLALQPADEESDAAEADDELSRAMDALGLVEEGADISGATLEDTTLEDTLGEVSADETLLPGPEAEFADLDALGSDEPLEDVAGTVDFGGAIDLDSLAPDEPDEGEAEADDVMDLAALAPDEPDAGEPDDVMDLTALAPDEPDADEAAEGGDVMELADLAPDEPDAEADDVMDLAALAPDEADAGEPDDVMDLTALAPDGPEEAEEPDAEADDVMDLAALAPDEAEDDVVDLAALAPEDSVEELAEAITDESLEEEEPDDEPSKPIYTRTLADLYVRQGFPDKALGVLKALQKVTPDDEDLARRITALEEGDPKDALSGRTRSTSEVDEPSGDEASSDGSGHSEDDVETRARELAERGKDGSDDVDVDTPFAWSASAERRDDGGESDEPAAGSYFDTLLEWENRGLLVKIAVIHGLNLRLLGRREPEVYGTDTLDDVNGRLAELAEDLGVELETFQSNHEGEILDYVDEASGRVDGFLINPGALTHTSIGLRDALTGVDRPFVEVHLSNTQAREPFRRTSFLSGVAAGVVYGFGVDSYLLGLRGLAARIGG